MAYPPVDCSGAVEGTHQNGKDTLPMRNVNVFEIKMPAPLIDGYKLQGAA